MNLDFCEHEPFSLRMSVQFSSVTQSCPTVCDPVNHSMPGLPFHHQLRELTQTHVHRVGDVIQPSYPLSSPSPPAFVFPSIRVFSTESVLPIRWVVYLNVYSTIAPRRQWQPTPVLLPGKSHGWRSLVGCSPWGH